MKTISTMAVAAAIAISALSFTVAAKAAKAGPTTAPEHYCLSYEAGSECGFTSYAQCEAMASGIGGDCRPDAGDRTREQPAHR
jgi:Spy/CpxP family protein refolding chaperone